MHREAERGSGGGTMQKSRWDVFLEIGEGVPELVRGHPSAFAGAGTGDACDNVAAGTDGASAVAIDPDSAAWRRWNSSTIKCVNLCFSASGWCARIIEWAT